MQEKTFYIQKNSNEKEKYSCAISKTAGKPFCKTNPKNKTTVKKKKNNFQSSINIIVLP